MFSCLHFFQDMVSNGYFFFIENEIRFRMQAAKTYLFSYSLGIKNAWVVWIFPVSLPSAYFIEWFHLDTHKSCFHRLFSWLKKWLLFDTMVHCLEISNRQFVVFFSTNATFSFIIFILLMSQIFHTILFASRKKIDDIFQVSSTVLQVLHSTVNQQSAGTKTSVKETLGRQWLFLFIGNNSK